ncbi:hypothetical protein DL96DRAFT_1715511 [Flagelloscypha sp. PMI_526]|nr:hypothetical protein DL96DRAFT_1715511 [Flagelloscypha sp. PMI_526]
MTRIELVPELWTEILRYCSKHELTRTSLVNSDFAEISRDFLYHTLSTKGQSFFRILNSLCHPILCQRLRYLILELPSITGEPGRSKIEALLNSLSSSNLRRLDISTDSLSMTPILIEFTRLPTLSYLKVVLPPLDSEEVGKVLQANTLKELLITDGNSISGLPVLGSSESSRRPSLTTLRISKGVVSWKKLARYVDLGSLQRLAVWDHEDNLSDLKHDWRDLIILSAPTLKDLSLWMTWNLLWESTPGFIQSSKGFPALSRLSLFLDDRTVKRVARIWSTSLLPVITAFCHRSPSLHHIRLFIYGSPTDYSDGSLLEGSAFSTFAAGLSKLQNIRTLHISSDYGGSSRPSKELMASISQMFYPILVRHEFGVPYYDIWPFFNDDKVSIAYD